MRNYRTWTYEQLSKYERDLRAEIQNLNHSDPHEWESAEESEAFIEERKNELDNVLLEIDRRDRAYVARNEY